MFSVVRNTDVKQTNPDHAVVIVVTSHAIFESGAGEFQSTEHCERGIAFPFIQAIQKVNERLLDKNPHETLLFDVILLSNDREESRSRIIDSTKHYGLEIGRFCFCNKEDSIESLLSNKVKLFLSTDAHDVSKALQRGVASALLHQQTANHSSEQLKVMFSGDAIGSTEDTSPSLNLQGYGESQLHGFKVTRVLYTASKDSIKELVMLLGDMGKRFDPDDSPLCSSLMTVWGSMDTCARALRTLRAWGLAVDEAYCLAGALRGPIISLVKPHVIFTDCL